MKFPKSQKLNELKELLKEAELKLMQTIFNELNSITSSKINKFDI